MLQLDEQSACRSANAPGLALAREMESLAMRLLVVAAAAAALFAAGCTASSSHPVAATALLPR
jgi:hypothetical protein